MSTSDWKCSCPKSMTGGDRPCRQASVGLRDDEYAVQSEICTVCGHTIDCCYDYSIEKRAELRMKIDNLQNNPKKEVDKECDI